jgi:hypothetical protein
MGTGHTESAIAPSLSPWLRADPWVVVFDAMRFAVMSRFVCNGTPNIQERYQINSSRVVATGALSYRVRVVSCRGYQ